jgi:hypothetical protein
LPFNEPSVGGRARIFVQSDDFRERLGDELAHRDHNNGSKQRHADGQQPRFGPHETDGAPVSRANQD